MKRTGFPGALHAPYGYGYDDGRRTSWNGNVVIAGATAARLEQELRDVQLAAGGTKVNLVLILAGALAVFFVGGAIFLRRRSRRPGYVKYQPV